MATSYDQAIDPALLTNSAASDRADDDLFADDQEGEAAETSQHQPQDDGDMGDLFGDEEVDEQPNQDSNRLASICGRVSSGCLKILCAGNIRRGRLPLAQKRRV